MSSKEKSKKTNQPLSRASSSTTAAMSRQSSVSSRKASKSREMSRASSLSMSNISKSSVSKVSGNFSKKRRKRPDGQQKERDLQLYLEMKTKAELRKTKTFRKIEHDIKMKKKQKEAEIAKSGGKREVAETYTDKDRAIAVQIGAEDLKGHVLKLRGQMVRSNRAEMEHISINVLLEQAKYELRFGEPKKCLSYLEKALSVKSDSIECLTLRSKCFLEMNRSKEALKDANEVLKYSEDAKDQKLLKVRGDALYNLGDFEHALLSYHRASKYSTMKERYDLRQRIIRSECAITNAVGSNATKYFKNLHKLLEEIPKNFIGLPWQQVSHMAHPVGPIVPDCDSKIKDKKFLNELADDKMFLEEMVRQLNLLDHSKTQIQETVLQEATETLQFLLDRRDFWSQQNPDHYEESFKSYSVHPSWKELIGKILKHNDVERLADEFNIFELF